MDRLGDVAHRVRSKNAGPFWITVDIFCGGGEALARVSRALSNRRVAEALGIDGASLKRFEIHDLSVLKFSFARPVVQGGVRDRDMHGAQIAILFESLEV